MRSYRKLVAITALLALIVVLVSATITANAQGSSNKVLKYGDSADGEIKSAKDGVLQVYAFAGKEGDSITVTVVRKSGNLRPGAVLMDPTLPKEKWYIASTRLSSDGKTATLKDFVLPHAGAFAIIVTREGVDKGTTTGKFTVTLAGPDDGSSDDTSGDEATPTKPKATATKAAPAKTPTRTPRATATPEDSSDDTSDSSDSGDSSSSTSTEGVSSIKVGKMPIFFTWSGSSLYVSNYGDGTVSVLDGEGNVTSTIKVGGSPFAMAWDGARLWVADAGSANKPGDSVNVFDKSGKKAGTFKVGGEPFSLSYDADNKRMWIALFGENKIVAVDAKGKVVTSVETDTNPNTVLWAGDQLWVTLSGTQDNPNNTVLAIDTDGNITGTYKVGNSPADLAWDSSSKTLYVANAGDNNVMALNSSGKVTGTFKVGTNPSALAWDGSHLWVTLSGDNAVVAIDKKGKVLTKVPLDTSPNGVTFDGTNVWVANQGTSEKPGSTVTRIDPSVVITG